MHLSCQSLDNFRHCSGKAMALRTTRSYPHIITIHRVFSLHVDGKSIFATLGSFGTYRWEPRDSFASSPKLIDQFWARFDKGKPQVSTLKMNEELTPGKPGMPRYHSCSIWQTLT